MSTKPNSDLDGYVMLVDAFVAGDLTAEPFCCAINRLWVADRDLKQAVAVAVDQREARSRQLMSRMCAGSLDAASFAAEWADLWACGEVRQDDTQEVLDGLHHWAYFYSPDPAVRASDPSFFVDESRLLELIGPVRNELKRLVTVGP